MADETFLGLYRDWCRAVGNGVEGFAVHRRLQASRQAFVLLLCAGDRSMLIRVRRDPAELHTERRISEAAERLNTRTFRVPRLRAAGERDGWNWTGYEVISRRPHAPALSTPPELFDEITELVEAVIPRPPAAPQSWRGCHGDLTPWNLRRAHRTTWLIDWEDAAYAPPGADRVYFAATASAIGRAEPRGPLPVTENEADAVQYWRDVLQRRETVEREARLSRRMAILLG
jgi:Ser/Thr protein kinase RdoA (MazF antagonist)